MRVLILGILVVMFAAGCTNIGEECVAKYNRIGNEVLGQEFSEIEYKEHKASDEGVSVEYHFKEDESDEGRLYCPYVFDENDKVTSELDEMKIGAELANKNGFTTSWYHNPNDSGITVGSQSREGKRSNDKATLSMVCIPKVGDVDFLLTILPPINEKDFSQHHLKSRYGNADSVKIAFHRDSMGELKGYAQSVYVRDDIYSYFINLNQRFDGKSLLEFLLDESQVNIEKMDSDAVVKQAQLMHNYGHSFSDDDNLFIKVTVGSGFDTKTYHFPVYGAGSKYALLNCINKGR